VFNVYLNFVAVLIVFKIIWPWHTQ